MTSSIRSMPFLDEAPLPVARDGMPIFYEDEEEGEMGESNPHTVTVGILHICMGSHLAGRPQYRVFSNMNLYYRKGPPHPRTGSLPYVSPDIMVVEPFHDLGEDVSSYTIGDDGPPPVHVTEILSQRSAQQRDLKGKPVIYARLRIPEYLLVDPTGERLPTRLLLKRLQPDLTWRDEQDADGGVTSRLGFRVIWDTDGRLRVTSAATGKPYARPDEAQSAVERLDREAKARRKAEERLRAAEEELARLRGKGRKRKGS